MRVPILAISLMCACSSAVPEVQDAGPSDASTPMPDSGVIDAGVDAGRPEQDAGTQQPVDGGTVTDGDVSFNTTYLGTVTADGRSGFSFSVPVGAVSSYLIATPMAGTSAASVVLYSLVGPNDAFSYEYIQGNKKYEAVPNASGGLGVMFPNAPPPRTTNNPHGVPGLAYSPGTYVGSLGTLDAAGAIQSTGGSYALTLLTKSTSGSLTTGTLDVNIWFDSTSLESTQAQTDSRFQAMLQDVQSIFASVGLSFGQVTFLELPDTAGAYRNVTSGADEGALCDLTAGAPNGGVNWVFVDSIAGGPGLSAGSTVLGESAGLPGTPVRGTASACVAIAAGGWTKATPASFASIVAHETGHWLGLFHPTESAGTAFDLVPDTPECPSICDTNGDGTVDDTECTGTAPDSPCGGGTNLMFWMADSTGHAPHTGLTPDQQFVLMRHPAVH